MGNIFFINARVFQNQKRCVQKLSISDDDLVVVLKKWVEVGEKYAINITSEIEIKDLLIGNFRN